MSYAHALGKRPILYRKSETRVHFDLYIHNVPEHRSATDLEGVLRRRFGAILDRAATDGSSS